MASLDTSSPLLEFLRVPGPPGGKPLSDALPRIVAGLRNVDDDLARAAAARPTRRDLAPSPALSILRNGPRDFAGRTIGILVTDGADAGILSAIRNAATREHARVVLVAPTVTGIRA